MPIYLSAHHVAEISSLIFGESGVAPYSVQGHTLVPLRNGQSAGQCQCWPAGFIVGCFQACASSHGGGAFQPRRLFRQGRRRPYSICQMAAIKSWGRHYDNVRAGQADRIRVCGRREFMAQVGSAFPCSGGFIRSNRRQFWRADATGRVITGQRPTGPIQGGSLAVAPCPARIQHWRSRRAGRFVAEWRVAIMAQHSYYL